MQTVDVAVKPGAIFMDERGRASARRRSAFLGAVVAGRVDQASEFGVLDAQVRSRAVVLSPASQEAQDNRENSRVSTRFHYGYQVG